jgi:hypothetical protein
VCQRLEKFADSHSGGRTSYGPLVAGKTMTRESDAVSRVAHAGEGVLKRLFDVPRRIVVGALDEMAGGLHHLSDRLRSMDPLDSRVAAIEKRLESLEKPTGTTARKAPARARSSSASRPRTSTAIESPRPPAQTPPPPAGGSTPTP